MALTEALALEVRAAAEDQNLTISELSHKAGTLKITMQRYLSSTRAIPLETLDRIAAVLHLRGSELVARAEQRTHRS
ncbi:helix-turn-helix domain-containing protein [Brachybacterium paraconglomeratum]|uniref:helix-turn-helix domain-containing protein n=1 Tax=Brachybacterium paraconglomeratum TaxID=173362 RepID=UPI0037FEDA81